MKKKVALLLAVIMVLSMLPLNVFGNSGVSQVAGTQPEARNHTLTISMADIVAAGFSTPVALNLDLSLGGGGAANNVFAGAVGETTATNSRVDGVPTALAVGVSPTWAGQPPTFEAQIVYGGTRVAQLQIIATGGVITGAPTEWVSINLPIISGSDAPTLSAVYNTVRIIDNRPLVLAGANGVTIGAGGARIFQDAVLLDGITIRENAAGTLNNSVPVQNPDPAFPANRELNQRLIRLIAPAGFSWSTDPAVARNLGSTINNGEPTINGAVSAFGTNPLSNWQFFRANDTFNNSLILADGRHALDIVFNADRLQNPNWIETLTLQNFVLFSANDAAIAEGEITVDVVLGNRVTNPTNGQLSNHFSTHNNWRGTVVVANRAAQGVNITVQGDELNEIISGRQEPGIGLGALTNVVRLTESAVGAFNVGAIGSRVEFAINTPGVILTGMDFRFGTSGDWTSATFINPLVVGDQTVPTLNAGGGQILNNVGSIHIPRVVQTAVRNLEVRFRVSVEAGAEYKYGYDIEVTVSGPMLQTPETVVAATIIDPIELALSGDVVQVGVGHTMATMQTIEIADLIIRETEAGMLTAGQRIRVDIRSNPLNVFWGAPALVTSTATVTAGNLRIQPVIAANRDYVEFVVTQASTGDVPGEITLSGNTIMGFIFPNVDYGFAVHGWGPVATDTLGRNTWLGGTVGVGRFDAIPYFIPAVVFGEFEDDAAPGDVPGDYTPPVHPGRQLTLGPDMRNFTTSVTGTNVPVPFRWVTNPVDANYVVGMVALRVFAEDFLGIDPVWDAANAMATLTAADSWGNEVTLLAVSNNPNASVIRDGNRVDGDIAADFVNLASGPRGSIYAQNIDGVIYLPVRFVAETFGYAVRMEGNMVVFS